MTVLRNVEADLARFRSRIFVLSLVVLLAFIGLKMLAKDYVHIQSSWSLLAIVAILGAGVAASLRWPEVNVRQEENSK